MAGSINKVILVGNLGNDPEIRSFQNGSRVANLSLATSESWKDRTTGERKEKTEWHRVVIFNSGLVDLTEKYLRKGSKVYIEGKLETRSYETSAGEKKYTTEVVLRPYSGELQMLDRREGSSASYDNMGASSGMDNNFSMPASSPASDNSMNSMDDFDDEIPF
ncbi:MAG: single-stranded DNA-binding protein [Alphaproteobacteria bacterium]|jgi:single-strand DNA-binding protein|nr:single-stranded DNA-binding protein [Alphaproteobacteria bacterium]MCV6599257.1 single-stranded DNA-binding protein [Alphaproteobacteria bacterium]